MMSSLDKQPSLSPNTVWRERRAFAYYFQYASASIGGGLDIDFWRTIVPQICRNEPAVWDAMISISSLFESPDPCPDRLNRQDALRWYSRSVSAVRQGIERGNVSPFVGLITCVLFICIESLLGSMEETQQLYSQGMHLIPTLRAQRGCGTVTTTELALLRETIVPIFARLGAFSPNSVWTLSSTLLRESEDTVAPIQEFASLKTAREVIVLLAAETALFELTCEEYLQESHAWYISEELILQQSTLSARLQCWRTAFTKLVESLRSRDALLPWQVSTSALLLAYYEMLFVVLAVCVSPSRITTDAYTRNFQNIARQATIALGGSARYDGTQPPFTFEITVGLPLWFTCLRCREPTIRRTALALLRRAHQVQGLHKRDQGAALAEKIMMAEEARAIEMKAAQSPTDFTTLKTNLASIEYQSYCRDIDTRSSLSSILDFDLAASQTPPLTDTESGTPVVSIPQEARIRPHGVFRPRDGYPPGATEEDIAKWEGDCGQAFLQFSWNECDRSNNTWKINFGYMPIDY